MARLGCLLCDVECKNELCPECSKNFMCVTFTHSRPFNIRTNMNYHKKKTKVTEQDVTDYIVKTETIKLGEKTTVVLATLKNGYEILRTSSCVDPTKYDETLGEKYALEKIRTEVWKLLGFTLQSKLAECAGTCEG